MAAADLIVGAGGTATWERCALGAPTLGLCLAQNQQQLLRDGSRAGILHGPDLQPQDSAGIARHLDVMLASPGWLQSLSRQGLAMVDGEGSQRVARRLRASEISVRPATPADSDRLFAWRNHPRIRAVSRSTEPLQRADHQRWLAQVLANAQRPLLIGEIDQIPIGVVRFDLAAQRAEVSIYKDPDSRQAGHGQGLLQAAEAWLVAQHPQVREVVAEVLGDNLPSHQLFAAAGYTRDTTRYLKKVTP